MNRQYAKLAQKIVYSSIWDEDGDTCKIWVTLLALKDKSGMVDANITGIARLTRIPIEKVEEAFLKFQSPDPRSTSEENEGRRIERRGGGWFVLNHAIYQEYGWSDEKREAERMRKQDYRERVAAANGQTPATAQPPPEKPKRFTPPTLEECQMEADRIDIPVEEGTKFFHHYTAKGWVVGRAPMKSYQSAMQNWKKNYSSGTFSQPAQNGAHTKQRGNVDDQHNQIKENIDVPDHL